MGGRVAEGLSELFSPLSPTHPDQEFQFMGLVASQVELHPIFSTPLVLLRLWLRWDKLNISLCYIAFPHRFVEMGLLGKSWSGIL
jgi:hypothetical protein